MTKSLPNTQTHHRLPRLVSRTYVAAFIVLALLLSAKVGFGQTVIFTETMGTVGGTTTIAAHETANGFDNDAYTMSTGGAAIAADLRATTPSPTGSGASGGANVFYTTTASTSRGFAIEDIDATGATNLQLSFWFLKINAAAANFTVDYWDGTAWQPVTIDLSTVPTNSWVSVGPFNLPAGAAHGDLGLRFWKGNDGTTSYRLDDVKLTKAGAAAPGVTVTPAGLTISGSSLTTDITIGPLAGYEFSLTSGSGYAASLTLTQSGGNVPLTDVFMRLSSQPIGSYNGTLNITSGATTVTRTVTGQAFKALSSFSPGNLAVARVGDGSAALSATAAPYFIFEYTKAGVKVDSGLVPVTNNGGNSRFTVVGNSTTSALMNLSPDRKYLVIAGTSAPVGTASITSSTVYPKVIGRINYQGVVNTSTQLNTDYNNNNVRSATTLFGDKFWVSGAGDINTAGVRFVNIGGTTASSISGGSVNNTRYVQISNSQLYYGTGSGTQGIYSLGTGLPESGPATSTLIAAVTNPEGFYFVDADGSIPGNDLLYVGTDGSTINKFRYNGTSWTAAGNATAPSAVFGIFAEVSGADVDVYYTTTTGIYKITDVNASASTFAGSGTLLVSALANTNFKGISLTPENVLTPSVDLTFTSPGATTVPQGTANKAIYRAQVDVSTATTTFTGVDLVTQGSYATADIINFKLWLSADNTIDGGDLLLSTDNTVTGSGETISFQGLGQPIPVGTHYLIVSADVSGCASTSSTVGITSTPIVNFEFGTAIVTGTPAAGSLYSITAGTPAPVSGLVLTRGQQNLPIEWSDLACSDNYLVVVHTAPISGTPTGTYTGNLNYAAAPAFPGGGKVVHFGAGNTITVTGLTIGTLYYAKVFNYVAGQYSTGVQDTATAKNTTFYSQASGTVLDPIWALSPVGTPQTVAALGGFANNKNLVVQTGHDVTYNASGSVTCLNLTVHSGASLATVSASQSYINLYGNVLNNGIIGGPAGGGNAEFTSFNLSGPNQTWSGNGTNTISRLRKNGGSETVTNFTIASDIKVTFSGTAVYNSSASTRLNITVNAGKTLNLTDASATLSLDGLGGADVGQIGGSLTVNGFLYVPLALSLQNNNTTPGFGTSLTIGSAGYVRTNNFTADMNGGQGMTLTIASGGQLVVRGTMSVVTGTVSTSGIKFEYNPVTGTPGRLTTLAGGANVTGSVTVEQRVPAAAGWHFMTAPVKGATFTQWAELTPRLMPKNNASLFRHDEGDTTRGEYNGFLVEYAGWKIVNSLSDQMNPGDAITGYRVFGRAPFITSNGKVSVTGQPFTGTVTRALTKTPTGWDGGGWNLIGNPYPSEIDWDEVITDNPALDIDQALYIWNGTTKSYGSYVGGTPSGGVTDKVATAQGFFVFVESTPGSISFQEDQKSATGAPLLREASADNELRMSMTDANGSATDEAVVKFATGATRGFDRGRDSRKLDGPVLNISSRPEGTLNLQINTMPELVGTQTLKLKVQVAATGTYKVSFSGMESFAPGTLLYLKDNFLGTLTDLATTPVYTFTVSQIAASTGDNRFELVASASGATGVIKPVATASFSVFPNPAQGGKAFLAVFGVKGTATAAVYGVDGAVKATFQFACGENETVVALPSGLKKGVYMVRVSAGTYSSTQKLVVE